MVAVCAELISNGTIYEHPADDEEPISEEWLHWVGGNYKYDADDEIEDCSFIGWSTNRGIQIGPSVALYVDDWNLMLDGTAVPGVHLKTRGDVRRLCRALGIELKEKP